MAGACTIWCCSLAGVLIYICLQPQNTMHLILSSPGDQVNIALSFTYAHENLIILSAQVKPRGLGQGGREGHRST